MKEGWKLLPLGDVCEELFAGGDVPKDSFSKIPTDKYSIPIFSNGETLKGLYGYTDRIRVSKPSITISARGTIGYTEKRENVFYPAVRLIVAIPNEDIIDLDYLKFAVQKIDFSASGTSIPQLTVPMIREYNLPIPPLPEQQRIVSILDEAFAAIDKAKANVQKNLANAKELFQSELNAIFSQKGEGWVEKKLGKVTFVKSGGTPSRSKNEYWSGAIPWYSSGELNNYFTKDPERFINELAIENSNAKLFPKGTLLIGMYDTAALKMSILDRPGTFNQAIAGVQPNDEIDLMFVMQSINSQKPALLAQRRGVRQKNLSLEKIKDITISVPLIEIQRKVVSDLEQLHHQTDRLEILYTKKLSELESVKKSILQKAFTGELVTKKEIVEKI